MGAQYPRCFSQELSWVIGVICGSEETVSTDRGFMDRTSYENLSRRTQPTFAQQRTIIYDIFLHYRRKKAILGDYDAAERFGVVLQMIGLL